MTRKHQPQRSCVVCREKKDKRELTRLAVANEKLQVDVSGKMNGRGAYLCDDRECWAAAEARSLMGKALRRSLSDDDREYLRQLTPS